MDQFWAGPPVTRTLAAAVFVESVAVAAKIINPQRLIFAWPFIVTSIPELWRFASSFLLTGGLSIVFVPYCIWNYGGALERNSSRFDSATLLIYLLFVGSVILVLSTYIFGSIVFTNTLILAISYTYAQENRGGQVSFFIVNIPTMYLPYAMLFLTFIQAGLMAMLEESLGIPAAHLYDFLTLYWPQFGGGVDILKTPNFVHRWFEGISGAKTVTVKDHGTAYRPSPQASSSSATSSGSA